MPIAMQEVIAMPMVSLTGGDASRTARQTAIAAGLDIRVLTRTTTAVRNAPQHVAPRAFPDRIVTNGIARFP